MDPRIALLAGCLIIFWLLKNDGELRQLPSKASWIPIFWLSIFGTRPVSGWLTVLGIHVELSAHGNAIDFSVLTALMIAAIITLARRNIDWQAFFAHNKLLVFIYLYLICTGLWADDTGETMKRAFKDFGSVPVALILLSERKPFEAIRTVFVRLSYFILILSVVFIKWFPEIGRRPDRGGSSLFCGVAMHKNTLGLIVFVFCLLIVADIFYLRQDNENNRNKRHIWIRYGLIVVGVWLLDTCNSKTSLVCLILGTLIIWGSKFVARLGNPKKIIFVSAFVFFVGMAIENEFQVSGEILTALGREPTLTGRTKIWRLVKESDQRPLLGYGYFSYWESKEANRISELWLGTLKSAHSGFLEMYLDSGLVGLVLLLLLVAQWAYRAVNKCLDGSLKGRLSLAFWVVAVIYNFSETSYFRAEPLWITLIILMMDYPDSSMQNPNASALDDSRALYANPAHV